jgi:hypothetical protein
MKKHEQHSRFFLKLTTESSYIETVMTITYPKKLFLLLLCLPVVSLAQSSSSVTQSVTVEVRPLTQIAVSGNPGPLFVTDIGAGESLTVSDNSTKYSMLTNLENMKIVASINGPMPLGTRLMMKMETSAGQSNGFVDVSNASTPVDLVTGISKGSDRNQSITYAFSADPSVTQVNLDSRVVTLTLTN